MWFYKESKNQQLKTLGSTVYSTISIASLFHDTWQLCNQKRRYLLIFFLFLGFVTVPCLLLLMYFYIHSLSISVSFFSFFFFLEETKTVYLPPARKSVLQDLPDYWKHEVSSMPGRKNKKIKKIYIYLSSHKVWTPSSTTSPPSQREQSVFVFTYVTHLEDLLTKGGGLQTKSEALALYVCNGALGTCRELKMFFYVPLAHFMSNLKCFVRKTKNPHPDVDTSPFWAVICSKCPGEEWNEKHINRSRPLLFNVRRTLLSLDIMRAKVWFTLSRHSGQNKAVVWLFFIRMSSFKFQPPCWLRGRKQNHKAE